VISEWGEELLSFLYTGVVAGLSREQVIYPPPPHSAASLDSQKVTFNQCCASGSVFLNSDPYTEGRLITDLAGSGHFCGH
jgi:hypothetical protein